MIKSDIIIRDVDNYLKLVDSEYRDLCTSIGGKIYEYVISLDRDREIEWSDIEDGGFQFLEIENYVNTAYGIAIPFYTEQVNKPTIFVSEEKKLEFEEKYTLWLMKS